MNQGCVEVKVTQGTSFTEKDDVRIHVRDTKDPQGPVLTFTPEEWYAFLAGVHDGAFTMESLQKEAGQQV